MKIAILTSGILPVPAVQGGAVENLIDIYLEYNHRHRVHNITVYSIFNALTTDHPALQSDINHYHYIKMEGFIPKMENFFFHIMHRQDEYYDKAIDFFLHKALRHIKRQHFDAIILENRPGFSIQLKKTVQSKLVYHLHNEKLTTRTHRYQDIYDAASLILTVSDYIKSLIYKININDTKTHTVHNGIDITFFSKKNVSRKSFASLRLTDTDFVIVYSGRINHEKGIDKLIHSMVLLKDHPQIKLIVIGGSFFGNDVIDDDFTRSLKQDASAIKDQIIFTGFVPYQKMPPYLEIADIAVIPSVWNDPFPTTVLEAQAMGLPIITTKRGGILEEVTTSNAILLDIDDHFAENLAAAILDLYQHPEKRELMSKASLERSRLFDKDVYAYNFFTAMEENLAK